MMKFEVVNGNTAVAVNSIKPVTIVRTISGFYDRNYWTVYTPEGGIHPKDTWLSRGPFVSWADAKRNAEINAGVQ